jgi:hypothetical protein
MQRCKIGQNIQLHLTFSLGIGCWLFAHCPRTETCRTVHPTQCPSTETDRSMQNCTQLSSWLYSDLYCGYGRVGVYICHCLLTIVYSNVRALLTSYGSLWKLFLVLFLTQKNSPLARLVIKSCQWLSLAFCLHRPCVCVPVQTHTCNRKQGSIFLHPCLHFYIHIIGHWSMTK